MRIGIDARAKTGIGRYAKNLISSLSLIDKKNEYVLFLNKLLFDELTLNETQFRKVLIRSRYYSFGEQIFLPLQIAQHQIDIMHFLHFSVPLIYNRPYIVTIHDLTLSFFPGKRKGIRRSMMIKGYRTVLNHAVKRANHIISVSEHTKNDISQITSVPKNKISVLYEGYDRSLFRPIIDENKLEKMRSTYHLPHEYILYIGVWRDHKNVINLIKAYHFLRQKYGITHKLIIAGEEDTRYPEIKQEIHRLNLASDVIITGFIADKDIASLYSAADLFVFPSFYEGFGLPPIESIACGTPVASSQTSCMPEILDNAAIFFDPYSIQDMADAIYRCISDIHLRNRLLDRGKKLLPRYNWKHMAEHTLELYTTLHGKK